MACHIDKEKGLVCFLVKLNYGKNKNTYVKTPTISKSVNIALFFCFCLCINGSNNQFCSSINLCTFA